jgi:hypothetical protein
VRRGHLLGLGAGSRRRRSGEGQRIVQELDTSDEDAFPGRHRAPASAVRRLSVRLVIAALGILVATGLGAATADLLGLSHVRQATSEGSPPRGIPQSPEEEPRAGRTTRPVVHPPQPQDLPDDPTSQGPPASAARAPAEQPTPAADPPAPAPVHTVRTGTSCPAVGQMATTKRGGAAVCTASRGNGPNKWRAG